MADKEERILISELRKYKGDMYKLTMFGNKDVLPVERVWQMCMTKQEVIEVMAEAMYYENYDRKELPVAFTEQYKGTQIYWKKIAEAALNALLEGGKK